MVRTATVEVVVVEVVVEEGLGCCPIAPTAPATVEAEVVAAVAVAPTEVMVLVAAAPSVCSSFHQLGPHFTIIRSRAATAEGVATVEGVVAREQEAAADWEPPVIPTEWASEVTAGRVVMAAAAGMVGPGPVVLLTPSIDMTALPIRKTTTSRMAAAALVEAQPVDGAPSVAPTPGTLEAAAPVAACTSLNESCLSRPVSVLGRSKFCAVAPHRIHFRLTFQRLPANKAMQKAPSNAKAAQGVMTFPP